MHMQNGLNDTLVGTAETKVPSIFLLVNVIARRAEQVMEGASPSLSGWNRGPIETALTEVAEGRLAAGDETLQTWILQPGD